MNLLSLLLIVLIYVNLFGNNKVIGGGSPCKGHIMSNTRYENIPSDVIIEDQAAYEKYNRFLN